MKDRDRDVRKLPIKMPDLAGARLVQTPPSAVECFTFDGRPFPKADPRMGPVGALQLILVLYMAKKARLGDPEAVEIMTALGIKVRDAKNAMYWPPEVIPTGPVDPGSVSAAPPAEAPATSSREAEPTDGNTPGLAKTE